MRRARRAFSLVENAVAIGLTGFSLVAMLGLVPVGLSGVKQTAGQQARAEMLRQLQVEVRRMPLSLLPTAGTPGAELFFDAQGGRLIGDEGAVYTAWMEAGTSNGGVLVVRLMARHGENDPELLMPLHLVDRRGALTAAAP